MKRVLFILCIILTLTVCSCDVREEYKFLNPLDEIESIAICEFVYDDVECIFNEIKKIDDKSAFISDFKNVRCYVWFGDPTGLVEEDDGQHVIRIIYENKEWEIIYWNAQAEYTHTFGHRHYKGFNVFEKKDYDNLIAKYLSN